MVTSLAIGTGGLGRFGNQLFTIAGVIGIADRSGQPFGFPEWKNYDNALFGGEVTNFSEVFENPLPDLRGITDFLDFGYFWGYRKIFLPAGNWSINAHLQSPKFFEDSIEKVRHYFKMKHEVDNYFDRVAVHFRAGDYIDNQDAYHPRQPKEYYQEAVKHFPKGTLFWIFSDDLKAASEIFDFIDNKFIVNDKDYLEDFAFMKKCKHFIIANSSFSAMAAHLADHPEKKVIAPKLWFGSQANGLDASDIYDKNWIVI